VLDARPVLAIAALALLEYPLVLVRRKIGFGTLFEGENLKIRIGWRMPARTHGAVLSTD